MPKLDIYVPNALLLRMRALPVKVVWSQVAQQAFDEACTAIEVSTQLSLPLSTTEED